MTGASAIASLGMTGHAAGASGLDDDEEERLREIAKSDESFVVFEGEDLEWEEPDETEQGPRLFDHCPSGDGLHWNPGVTAWGYGIDFTIEDCPDSCEWEASASILGQSYGLATNDECEAKEVFSVGVKPLRMSGSIRREQLFWGSTIFVIVSLEATVEYYSPWNGWQEKKSASPSATRRKSRNPGKLSN